MTDSSNPDEIRADIERTRAELSRNVDTLGDTVNPKNIATRQVDRVKDKARNLRDSIMGSPDDPYGQGRAGELQSAVSDKASAVGDAVANAPQLAQQKTRGNPLAAGLIAFGVGLLVSSLIPASRKEQQAVGKLQDNLDPLKQQTFNELVLEAKREGATVFLSSHVLSEVEQTVDDVVIIAKGDKHINEQYPFKFTPKESEDIAYKGAVGREGGTFETTRAVLRVPFVPKKTGGVSVADVGLQASACPGCTHAPAGPALRTSLLKLFKEEDLPRNVYYGDGSKIEDSTMEQLGKLFWERCKSFPWQNGDLIMLDNMLISHARKPFTGARKIVVAMGEMINATDLPPV